MNINYSAPKTCARFMQSASFGRLIAGPVGSGKTTACMFELFRRACEQGKAPDGLRYTRFSIVRQTLSQLKQTVLKDITQWLQGIATFKVSDSTIYISIGDVRSEWVLIPLDNPEDQARLLSSQLTGAWMSEAIEMNVGLVAAIAGRCGRYPSAAMGGCTWFGMIADTNMPSEGSDWYKFMETNTPPDWQVFIQPGGLDDNAENLEWLTQTVETLKLPPNDPVRVKQGRTYYERLSRNPENWVKRYVHAQYGDDPSGTAVFGQSFKSSFHVTDDLQPISGKPLIVGQDFGRDPCSAICQLDHLGRMLVLEEVIAEDIGLELHVERALRSALGSARYFGMAVAVVGDPSGGSKSSIYEETTFDVLKRMGFNAFPAPTNDLDPRLRSIESFLLAQRGGGPAMLFDRNRCPTIIRGMGGGYRYAKTKTGQRKPQPDKNEYSHVIDALQYACLAAHGGMADYITSKLRRLPYKQRPRITSAAWT